MGSNVTPSTAIIKLSVELKFDNRDYGFEIIRTVNDITEVRSVIVDVPIASEIEVFEIDNSLGIGGLGALADTDLIILANEDDTNFIRGRVNVAGLDTIDIKIPPTGFFILHDKGIEVNLTEAAFVTFANIDEIKAQADTAECQLRAMIIST